MAPSRTKTSFSTRGQEARRGPLHCGVNTLHVYGRDAACVVSAVIYSATFTIEDCTVSTEAEAWGEVKALYR